MVAESFTLVRAHGLSKVGDGGGTEHEQIEVHLVPRHDVPDFLERKRASGCAVDVRLLLLLGPDYGRHPSVEAGSRFSFEAGQRG